jgi:hypothetical protein
LLGWYRFAWFCVLAACVACAGDDGEQVLRLAEDGVQRQAGAGAYLMRCPRCKGEELHVRSWLGRVDGQVCPVLCLALIAALSDERVVGSRVGRMADRVSDA